jgi:hypothetical protein
LTGTWYWLYHTSQTHNEDVDCAVTTLKAINKKLGRIIAYVHVKR